MAVSRIKTSSVLQGFPKSRSLLAGNTAYDPAATWLIQRVNPTGASTLTFSSIPGTYKHLQIRFAMTTAAAGYAPQIQFNSDTGNNYARHRLYCDGATVSAGGAATQDRGWLGDFGLASTTTQPMVGIVDILDYASTSKAKTVRAITGVDANGSGGLSLTSSLWTSTSAITSVTIFFSGSTFSGSSTYALYGMVG